MHQRNISFSMSMMWWMHGLSLKKHLLDKTLGIDGVLTLARYGNCRWFSHVEQQGNKWIRIKVDGSTGRGSRRKFWWNCMGGNEI